MNYSYILPVFNPGLQKKVDYIDNIIKISEEHSKKYLMYTSHNILSKSLSEDDWSFCILILKFSSSDEQFNDLFSILNYFLCRYRYRDKCVKHISYLDKNIKQVIYFVLRSNLLISYLDIVVVHEISFDINSHFSKSINENFVIKSYNIFNIFICKLLR
uniref:Uncharacterized protein n=1 Tax=Gracilaria firma TaxID=2510791 RepID=A0A1P8D6K1_9FLOR|nr:hypothetical protein [Gracilaria firma]APR74433.1 hypothetical protein [Gracilaria firma]